MSSVRSWLPVSLVVAALSMPALAGAWPQWKAAFPSQPCGDGWAGCVIQGGVVDPGLAKDAAGRARKSSLRFGWFDLAPAPGFSPFQELSPYRQAPAGAAGILASAEPVEAPVVPEPSVPPPDPTGTVPPPVATAAPLSTGTTTSTVATTGATRPTSTTGTNGSTTGTATTSATATRPTSGATASSTSPTSTTTTSSAGRPQQAGTGTSTTTSAAAGSTGTGSTGTGSTGTASTTSATRPVGTDPAGTGGTPVSATTTSGTSSMSAGRPTTPEAAVSTAAAEGCDSAVTLEPLAMMGQLSAGQVRCVEGKVGGELPQTTRDRYSRVLIANAEAKGDKTEWERLVRRHLEDIDRSDPDLCYKYALQLSRGGATRAAGVIRWADYALENKHRWSGDTYKKRVNALLKLRAEASGRLWEAAEKEYTTGEHTEENEAKAAKYRGMAKDHAKEWLDYARSASLDTQTALSLCVAAAGNRQYCEG